jgi:signal transduction histidine kinase
MRHGGLLRLRISGYQVDNTDRVRITIADTGAGIPPEVLPTIFEPFVTTKGETGTGLGLWVTSEIIKKNRWAIRVRTSHCNRNAGGTVFSISIPSLTQTTAHRLAEEDSAQEESAA